MPSTERTPAATAAGTAASLLVVDDEPTVRELLPAALRYAGFTVAVAATGSEAVAMATAPHHPPDLVLLDVMLPDMDGFEVLRRLREQPPAATGLRGAHVPVLFLTARDAVQDKIDGLLMGGDDYVTKPFDLRELIARIQAVLRRTSGDPSATLLVGDLELDLEARQVYRSGAPIRLSPTEFRLLHYLMANAGRTVSKAHILERVWRYDFGGDASIVDTYISYLRRKVDAGAPRLIHTVHGVGYVIRADRP